MVSPAPSAAELEAHPAVHAAFAAAWADSFPDDETLRYKEGGFIYANPTIRCDQALAVAHAEAVQAYHDPLTRHRIEVRLEPEGWVVEYHFRGTGRFHTGGGPHYGIHPETGEIVSKKYYQ